MGGFWRKNFQGTLANSDVQSNCTPRIQRLGCLRTWYLPEECKWKLCASGSCVFVLPLIGIEHAGLQAAHGPNAFWTATAIHEIKGLDGSCCPGSY